MNFSLIIESVLSEETVPELELQRYKLYIDLNDHYLKCIMRKQKINDDCEAKENIETVNFILEKYHRDLYQDLNKTEVDKVKHLFKADYLMKKATEYALGGLEGFIKHYREYHKIQKSGAR